MRSIPTLVILFLSLCSALAVAQSQSTTVVTADQSRMRPLAMEKAEQWTMRSKSGRTFEISVAHPMKPAPTTGYPVMYVLDPSTAFATLVDTVRNQEPMFGPVMVVGVGYASDSEIQNRSYDLTPLTDPKDLPEGPPAGWGANGGNDAFLSFIVDELKPVIAKQVQVDEHRQALFGHSLGGLFVLHALFSRADAFDTYIAGSPSIWWGKKSILRELPAYKAVQERSKKPRRLLITVGELEAAGSPEEIRMGKEMKIDADTLMKNAKQVANSAELASELAPLAQYGLKTKRVVFEGETHISVIPAYLARGARLTLQGWFE